MFPNLYPGQDVLSFNWAYLGRKPKVGDIVVIKMGDKEIVKRVQKVDDRHIFVVGDNQNESMDSRDFGEISINNIVGKLVYRSDEIPCPQCDSPIIGIYGRKDAICQNCGFKLGCCGEP